MKKLLGLLAVAPLAMTACGGAVNPTGTMVVAVSADPKGLHPHIENDSASTQINQHVYETLVVSQYENSGMFKGSANLLAKSVEQMNWDKTSTTSKADAAHLLIELKDGVKFGKTGNVMTADDVVYSINAAIASDKISAVTQGYMGAEKTADGKVKVYFGVADEKTTTPEGTFDETKVTEFKTLSIWENTLSHAGFAIVEKAHDTKLSNDEKYNYRNANGTGPYIVDGFRPQTETKLKRRTAEEYHGGEVFGDETVIFKFIKEATSRQLALKSGEIDAYYALSKNDAELAIEDGNKVFEIETTSYSYIGFNLGNPGEDGKAIELFESKLHSDKTVANGAVKTAFDALTSYIDTEVSGAGWADLFATQTETANGINFDWDASADLTVGNVVRAAMYAQLNVDNIIAHNDIAAGVGKPLTSNIAPTVQGYEDDLFKQFNAKDDAQKTKIAELSKAVIDAAKNSATDKSTDLKIRVNDGTRQKIAEQAKSDMAAIGINLTIESSDWTSFLDSVGTGAHDMFVLGWSSITSHIAYGMYGNWHKGAIGSTGYSFYDNPAISEGLDAALWHDNTDGLYTEIQKASLRSMVHMPLYTGVARYAYNKDVSFKSGENMIDIVNPGGRQNYAHIKDTTETTA